MTRRPRRLVSLFACALVLGAWWMLLRPPFLGGSTTYVMVSGTSMEPTLADGDLVVVRQRAAYEVGDTISYRVPAGEVGAGAMVIHRVVGGSAREGYVTQGDNRDQPDRWRPRPSDIVGERWLRVPGAGRVVARLRTPFTMAAVFGALTLVLVLTLPEDGRRRRPAHVPPPEPTFAAPAGPPPMRERGPRPAGRQVVRAFAAIAVVVVAHALASAITREA